MRIKGRCRIRQKWLWQLEYETARFTIALVIFLLAGTITIINNRRLTASGMLQAICWTRCESASQQQTRSNQSGRALVCQYYELPVMNQINAGGTRDEFSDAKMWTPTARINCVPPVKAIAKRCAGTDQRVTMHRTLWLLQYCANGTDVAT